MSNIYPSFTLCPICPDYVQTCYHKGIFAVWLLTKQACRREANRRGILGIRCPKCMAGLTQNFRAYAVIGPGIPSEPTCLCRVGLDIWHEEFSEFFSDNYERTMEEFMSRVILVPGVRLPGIR